MSPFDPTPWLQASLALAAVLGAAWLLGRAARRRRAFSPGRLAVQAALPLDARRRLLLIRCDEREGLVLTGPAGDAWLGWLDAGRAP
jgi:flagellar protein FliO/FliZ